MSDYETNDQPPVSRKWYQAIGPAVITACVVIGPGSIMTSSNVGATQGYGMAWVVVLSVIFMLTFMTMGAKLGVVTQESPSEIIRKRMGKLMAILIGCSVFFISAAFQFGNNLGVHMALVEFIEWDYLIVLFNLVAILFLLAFKEQYKVLEKVMMCFVALMLISFAINLSVAIFNNPRPGEILAGFNPFAVRTLDINVLGLIGTTFVVSAAFYQSYLVKHKGWSKKDIKIGLIDVRVGSVVMGLITLMLIFTPATLFHPDYKYQRVVSINEDVMPETLKGNANPTLSYLISEGIIEDQKHSPSSRILTISDESIITDSTEDSLEYGTTRVTEIIEAVTNEKTKSKDGTLVTKWVFVPHAAIETINKQYKSEKQLLSLKKRAFGDIVELGTSLEALFKGIGPTIFYFGVFAAAYSSFLVNSMIGGFILSDGLGLGQNANDKWPRILTICVLLVGMFVGLYAIIELDGERPVTLVVAAQAMTVLASPLVAGVLLYLTCNKTIMGDQKNGPLLTTLGIIGFLVLLAMSLKTLFTAVLPKLGL